MPRPATSRRRPPHDLGASLYPASRRARRSGAAVPAQPQAPAAGLVARARPGPVVPDPGADDARRDLGCRGFARKRAPAVDRSGAARRSVLLLAAPAFSVRRAAGAARNFADAARAGAARLDRAQ